MRDPLLFSGARLSFYLGIFSEAGHTRQRFQGKIYLLIGPDTFSAAITFATILQDYDLALLLGEETSDSASFCAFVSAPFPLPRTHLLFVCSTRCYLRPSGLLEGRGVIPDIVIKTTVQDRLAGIDPVLAYTLEMIRNGKQNP